jgi:molybdate transport system ATP-binding protein
MIDVRIEKRWPGFHLDAAFSAPATGITALFGRSGAGKTSILQAIAGAFAPDAGHIGLDGTVFFDSAHKLDLPVHERRIGYVFQDTRLFPHMSVNANLLYGHKRRPGDGRVTPDAVIELLGIRHLLERRPHHLSGGERQRVAIGRALLSHPALLLMDEPLASLDPPRRAEVLPYIERLRDEFQLPILYISHAFNEVVRLADYMVLMDAGRVVRHGALLDIAAEPEMSPLIGRFETGSVLECTVVRHDEDVELSTLAFSGGELRVPQVELVPGSHLRVRIRARDVALSLSRPMDVSITNRLPGRLVGIVEREGPFADVSVDVGGAVIRALITRESVARLGLEPGVQVWALIKTVAFDSRAIGFTRRARPISDLES